jgi:hypothetical protein
VSLFEGPEGATLNHLGVETENAAQVEAAEARLSGTGLETTGIDDAICCHATKQVVGEGETTTCCAPDATETVSLGHATTPVDSGCCLSPP